MATWAELANADPALGAFGRERIDGRIVYHATLRLDGSPRVHPVSPWIATGLLVFGIRAHSPKAAEFARDGRYAMHTAQAAEDHEGDAGEFMVRGWMEQVGPDHPAVVQTPYRPSGQVFYACSVEEAVSTTYEGDRPVYRRWRA
ncbi:MAG: hypothetical protein WD096_06860 [Actinomycetota bacterium]